MPACRDSWDFLGRVREGGGFGCLERKSGIAEWIMDSQRRNCTKWWFRFWLCRNKCLFEKKK